MKFRVRWRDDLSGKEEEIILTEYQLLKGLGNQICLTILDYEPVKEG